MSQYFQFLSQNRLFLFQYNIACVFVTILLIFVAYWMFFIAGALFVVLLSVFSQDRLFFCRSITCFFAQYRLFFVAMSPVLWSLHIACFFCHNIARFFVAMSPVFGPCISPDSLSQYRLFFFAIPPIMELPVTSKHTVADYYDSQCVVFARYLL